MSSVEPCYFCQQLPLLDRTRSGKESRCPLCKSPLFAADSGTTYRYPSEEEKKMQPRGFFRWFRKPAPVSN